MPGPDDELAEEERRQRREQAVDAGDAGSEVAGERTGWCDGCDVPSCDAPSCDVPGCDLPDCDCGGCDLLRVSSLLAVVALVVPAGTGGLVASLVELAVRGYLKSLYARAVRKSLPRRAVIAALGLAEPVARTVFRRPITSFMPFLNHLVFEKGK